MVIYYFHRVILNLADTFLASQIIRGNKPNQMWNDGIDSDSDSEVAIEEQTEKATSDSAPETSELEELCLAIGSSNSNLMKLSMLIRDSSNRDDYLKAASRYSNWDPNPYIGHVREKYGSARGNSDWLVDRLGKSILRRRQFLRYREEHHGKLTGDVSNSGSFFMCPPITFNFI